MQILFTSGMCPDILMKVFEDYIIFPIWKAWVCLFFVLSKNKDFLSGVLLNIPPSSPYIKEFEQ